MNEINKPEQGKEVELKAVTAEQVRQKEQALQDSEVNLGEMNLKDGSEHSVRQAGFERNKNHEKLLDEDTLGKNFKSNGESCQTVETFKPETQFGKENFSVENSHDASASQTERDLAAKYVMPLQKMGDEPQQEDGASEIVRQPIGEYSYDEKEAIKAEREKIDMPDESTIMQKVIGVDTGNIEADLKNYLNPTDRDSDRPVPVSVYGFVAKADDVAPFTQTPQKCHDVLRLDYENTAYKNPEQSVYAIRFTNGTNYEIPYSTDMGGHINEDQPFTGSGYIGCDSYVIPEYTVVKQGKDGAVVTDGEIYRINPDGSEYLVAVFDEDKHKFVLVEEGKNDS